MFTIGTLSRETGVKIPTIRYYEQVGLLKPTERTAGNQRRYTNEGLKRLSFIKHSRAFGFSLEDIQELLDLADNSENDCGAAHEISSRHLTDVRAQIAKLRRLEKELLRISKCGSGAVANCAVLETLADHRHCKSEH